jgi:hypothetical protein
MEWWATDKAAFAARTVVWQIMTRNGNCPGFPVVEFEATVWF